MLKLKEIDSDVKVVMTSGYMPEALHNELKKLGIKSFIQKPYNVEELSKIIYNTIYEKDNGT